MGLKDFFEKLQNDEDFGNKVYDAVIAKKEAGPTPTDKNDLLISVAKDFGYSITEEEAATLAEYQKNQAEELSEEEMGKVAGGTMGFVSVVSVFVGIGALATAVGKIMDAISK